MLGDKSPRILQHRPTVVDKNRINFFIQIGYLNISHDKHNL